MRYHYSSYDEGVFDEYLFEKNLQGDVVAVYDINGAKLVSYTYDAWCNFEINIPQIARHIRKNNFKKLSKAESNELN